MNKPIQVEDTRYYVQSSKDDRQFLTIIGELPEGWDRPRQSITVRASIGWVSQTWGPAEVSWPSLGGTGVELTNEFITALKCAVQFAARIDKNTAKLNAARKAEVTA